MISTISVVLAAATTVPAHSRQTWVSREAGGGGDAAQDVRH
ncbi:hypothetical protein ABT143_25645 [Streptomyces sp. NPDC002033]